MTGADGDDDFTGGSGDDQLFGGLDTDGCDGGDGIDFGSSCETSTDSP